MRKMRFPQLVALLVFTIFLISMVSASVSCNPSFKFLNYSFGQAPSGEVTISNCNGIADSIQLQNSPSGVSFGSDSTSLSGSKNINLQGINSLSFGSYLFSINFFDNSTLQTSIPISITITQQEVQQGDILVFPTSTIVNVQQGNQKTKNIQISVPQSYPRIITIQSVDLNPSIETISFGDLNLGQVAPGQSVQIPLIFSAIDAQSGNYQTNLNIFATDSEGQIEFPTINLQLQVTTGVTPVDSTTFSTKPSCTLSSNDLNLNSTYLFSCSGVVNNLKINPQLNEFFEGLSGEYTSNTYEYVFRATKFGNTEFIASFSVDGSPIFIPFKQEVRVKSTSGVTPGTELTLNFIPPLNIAKENEEISIQVLDNKSKSLVDDTELYLDGIVVTNMSGRSFRYSFLTNRNYSVRATANGYSDLETTIFLSAKPITISITPSSGNTQTQFTLTTDSNATLFINGENKGESYLGTLQAGLNIIEAFKEGFLDTKKNITVESSIIFSHSGEFKKGVLQTITLNKNTTWQVYYQKNADSQLELLSEGTGNQIEFEPTKVGSYVVKAEDSQRVFPMEGTDWFGWLKSDWWFLPGYIWIIIAGLGIFGFYYYKNGHQSSGSMVGFGGSHPKDFSANVNY